MLSLRHSKIWPAAALVGLAGVAALWLARDEGQQPELPSPDQSPVIEALNVKNIVVRENGRPAWSLDARRITLSADHRTVEANGVSRGVLFRNSQPWLQLQAQRVRLDQMTRDLEARGQILARGQDGLMVRTELALWQQNTRRLTCPQGATASFKGVRIESPFVVYVADRKQIKCPGVVRVSSSRGVLTGQNATADIPHRRVEMKGEVEIVFRNPRALLGR